VDPGYRPRVTVIVPTFNEAGFIEVKLDNIYGQDYLRGRLEVIVVDSASSDGTPEIVRRWAPTTLTAPYMTESSVIMVLMLILRFEYPLLQQSLWL